jgi:hypothetical protein
VPILQRLLYYSATVRFSGHGCLSSPCLEHGELPYGKENNETLRVDKGERPYLEGIRSKEKARGKHCGIFKTNRRRDTAKGMQPWTVSGHAVSKIRIATPCRRSKFLPLLRLAAGGRPAITGYQS